jgi:lariat debranching enzyme
MPAKYRRLGSFPTYYSGEKKAPILTLFIGGNHEASQPLRELYYGGWAAPNIYYLGTAGVVKYGGIRIGGISSIYKSHDYELGHYGTFNNRHSVQYLSLSTNPNLSLLIDVH